MIDFNLTVSRGYIGEYLDALGIQHALEEEGYEVRIHELDPLKNIRRPVYTPPCKVNINFHSSYHLNDNAEQNFLFYHEVHDKTGADDPKIPLGTFQTYRGIFTPAKKFAEAMGINHLQMAADPYYYYKVPYKKVPKEFKCDVVFVGNNHRDRDSNVLTDILKELVGKYKIHVYGAGWDIPEAKGLLPLSDAKYAYSGAKVGLNVGGAGMVKWGTGTNRLYQMGACGLATVSYFCEDYIFNEYDRTNGNSIKFAGFPAEFVTQIESLLRDDKVRRKHANWHHKDTLSENLWKHRIKDLLRIIEKPNRGFRQLTLSDNQIDEMKCSVDILVGIPGEVDDFFTTSMTNAFTMGTPPVKFDIFMPKRSFTIADARNKMCEELMAKNYKYLLMIDTDLKIPPHTLDCLIEDIDMHDMDIVCGYYHRIEEDNKVLPHFHVEVDGVIIQPGKFRADRLIRVYNAPPGLMMISRRVIQAFNDNHIDPFVMTPQLSEGPYFCKIAQEMGFKVYVDPRVVATHIRHALLKEDGTVDLL